MNIKLLYLILEAIPVLFKVFKELEQDQRDANIKKNVYRAWSDKFGQLHDAEPELPPSNSRSRKNE